MSKKMMDKLRQAGSSVKTTFFKQKPSLNC
jgi:hypothetical protein